MVCEKTLDFLGHILPRWISWSIGAVVEYPPYTVESIVVGKSQSVSVFVTRATSKHHNFPPEQKARTLHGEHPQSLKGTLGLYKGHLHIDRNFTTCFWRHPRLRVVTLMVTPTILIAFYICPCPEKYLHLQRVLNDTACRSMIKYLITRLPAKNNTSPDAVYMAALRQSLPRYP